MIGSFWNFCRACPSMPVDKLHSEYRSTYRWHEYTGNPRPEVVRKPPIPNNFGPINEPPLPRRKKCPELAYKTHEFIGGTDTYTSTENDASTAVTRARSEERGTPSRRSKSEGPAGVINEKVYKNVIDGGIGDSSRQAGESSGLFKKTISKLSTEYRLQFVWPQVRRAIKGQPNDPNADYPRKSLSMNALKSTQSNIMPTVHKKRTTKDKEATVSELEPLVNDGDTGKSTSKNEDVPDRKTQGMDQDRANRFMLTKKENFGFSEDMVEHKNMMNGIGRYDEDWYKEVIELRKKAGEYKCRGWGIEIDPELYKKQKELWDQVSKRSSLSALSLASSIHRPITKEEKDEENNKKSYQAKPFSKIKTPGQVHPFDNKSLQDGRVLPARVQTIRHHLERTTGHDIEEGALLPSPTREKLMPVIPKQREPDSYSSQKGSPKKSEASRHGSPQKGSPQKGSPKKTGKGRSQSVGPSVAADNYESPKRQMRSISTAPSASRGTKASAAGAATTTVGASTPSSNTERRPRPYDGEETAVSVSSCSPQPATEITEHIVKSPPEPTRVKSPEQILMRSPDPVNWTVPLDTGKTFTVTQNVKDGEFYNRPQSEVKASTPVERPPPAPQSAPPELTEQSKMEAWTTDFDKDILPANTETFRKSTQQQDPSSDNSSVVVPQQQQQRSIAVTDVFEMARNRFDSFWGGHKEANV